jgi:hypothetical protein
MNEPRADILIRVARAIDADLTAADYAQAADQSQITPEAAARYAWDAASVLQDVGDKLADLAERQRFVARRMDAAQRRENATGVEHRSGDAA